MHDGAYLKWIEAEDSHRAQAKTAEGGETGPS